MSKKHNERLVELLDNIDINLQQAIVLSSNILSEVIDNGDDNEEADDLYRMLQQLWDIKEKIKNKLEDIK